MAGKGTKIAANMFCALESIIVCQTPSLKGVGSSVNVSFYLSKHKPSIEIVTQGGG